MKRKTKRNICIAVIAVVVIALIVTAILLLRKDDFGHNAFERATVIASVNGDDITLGEFSIAYSNSYSNIQYYQQLYSYYGMSYSSGYDTTSATWLDELREDTLDSLIRQRIYIQKAEELGLTLDEETQKTCKNAGKDAVSNMESSYRSSLESSGYTGATLEQYLAKSMSNYYTSMGMTKQQYMRKAVYDETASAYGKLVETYYEDSREVTDDERRETYTDYVQQYYIDGYSAGDYTTQENAYQAGSVAYRYLYIPESFLFVRVAKLNIADETEAQALIDGVTTENFESYVQSEDNLDTYIADTSKMAETEAYAIGADDSLFASDVYELAVTLDVGQVGGVKTQYTDTADGAETITWNVYLVERMDGQTGVVPYDTYNTADATTGVGAMDSLMDSYIKYTYYNDLLTGWMQEDGVQRLSDAYKSVVLAA